MEEVKYARDPKLTLMLDYTVCSNCRVADNLSVSALIMNSYQPFLSSRELSADIEAHGVDRTVSPLQVLEQ